MGTDFFFRMGASHSICQDYCLAGKTNNMEYAVLSDGCSGLPIPGQPGSPYTDFGARFLARSAVMALDEHWSASPVVITWHASTMINAARLPPQALDATLLMAWVAGSNIRMLTSGDGVKVIRYRDGSITVNAYEYSNNMPFYLGYTANPSRLKQYLREVTQEHAKETTRIICRTDGAWMDPVISEAPIVDEWQSSRFSAVASGDVDLVLLFSDGIESFQDDRGQLVTLTAVLDELMDFKNYTGQFVARRCARFLKDAAARGWKHSDDFSCAGIYLGDL